MSRIMKRARLISLAISASTMAIAAQVGHGQELPFSEAQLYLELNHTDGDLGIHGLIDGDTWKSLEIENPSEQLLMNVLGPRQPAASTACPRSSSRATEPSFDELAPAAFFKRFPEGIYEIEAITLEDEEMEGEVRLSHVLAGPPGNIRVNGKVARP